MIEYVYTAHNSLWKLSNIFFLCKNERLELLNTVIKHSPNLADLPNDENFIMLKANKEKLITDALGKYMYMYIYIHVYKKEKFFTNFE